MRKKRVGHVVPLESMERFSPPVDGSPLALAANCSVFLLHREPRSIPNCCLEYSLTGGK